MRSLRVTFRKKKKKKILRCLKWAHFTPTIQGEHKNTHWFQVVTKSKLTGIFLQNWWLQLHKLIQFHVVSHTLNVPPFLSLGKHRCDNLARTRLSAAYLAWPSWQLLRDRRSAWMSLSLITDESSFNEIPVPLQNGLVSRRIHIKFAFESTLLSHNTVCFMKFQHAPAALLWSERLLAFHCPLAAGGKIKNLLS